MLFCFLKLGTHAEKPHFLQCNGCYVFILLNFIYRLRLVASMAAAYEWGRLRLLLFKEHTQQ
jgi:hypothetical protein